MKALILAAGRGTRLGELTAERPKPMLPIAGVPMVERIMAGIARETTIREFVLVTGYRAEAIETHFGDGARWGWDVRYAHQERPQGVGHAVGCARDLLQDTPFLMTYGDIILSLSNYGRIVQEHAAHSDRKAIVTLNWVDDPWAGAAVYLNDDGTVARIQEKPKPGTAQTHWNNAGLFIFDPLIFDFIAKIAPSPRGEYELPDALTAMISAGNRVGSMPLNGEWRDVGTPEDYAAINAEYAGT